MEDPIVKITFKMKASKKEQLLMLAARARCGQSEFLRTLIEQYGEQLVQKRRGE